jgi:Flp pilus assembly protein TadG
MPDKKSIRTQRTQVKSTSALGPRERGQSLVEMAVLVPILVLLVAIVIDAARAFDAYIVLTNAAREGARFGSLQLDPTPIEVELLVINDVVGSGTNITNMSDFGDEADDVVLLEDEDAYTVTVSYDFPLWFGGVLGMQEFHLEKTAAMPKVPVEE